MQPHKLGHDADLLCLIRVEHLPLHAFCYRAATHQQVVANHALGGSEEGATLSEGAGLERELEYLVVFLIHANEDQCPVRADKCFDFDIVAELGDQDQKDNLLECL